MSKYYGADRINIPSGYVNLALKHAAIRRKRPYDEVEYEQRTKTDRLKEELKRLTRRVGETKTAFARAKFKRTQAIKEVNWVLGNGHHEKSLSTLQRESDKAGQELRKCESAFFAARNNYNNFVAKLSWQEKALFVFELLSKENLSEPEASTSVVYGY